MKLLNIGGIGERVLRLEEITGIATKVVPEYSVSCSFCGALHEGCKDVQYLICRCGTKIVFNWNVQTPQPQFIYGCCGACVPRSWITR